MKNIVAAFKLLFLSNPDPILFGKITSNYKVFYFYFVLKFFISQIWPQLLIFVLFGMNYRFYLFLAISSSFFFIFMFGYDFFY